ncbi:MAG TPA: Cof-type HAD-IIB family hydrolase [Ktedonobacteraceae bacterium]|nr:Cof-type HAD-IIB family hydrolase [Ktedonobacteraceae bacterium]
MMTEELSPTRIKMLVIDIDGTLLNPEGEITSPTLAAVQAAQRAGIIVTLATARRYCNTKQIADELGLEIPLILYDGAMTVQHPEGTILHRQTLRADIAQQAVAILVSHSVQPVVHPDTGLNEEIWTGPADFDNLWLDAYFTTFPAMMHRLPYKHLCRGQADPLRVVAFDSEETIQALAPQIAALDCSWTSIKRGNYGSAELVVMRTGCSKASGIEALAKRFSLQLSEVMALGDNNNDIPMLQSVGWGIAMGQAPQAVKAAARVVTASNQEDGVARAIERYALGDGALEACLDASTLASNSLKRATCL